MPRSLRGLFTGMFGELALVGLIILGLYCIAARADTTASHKQRSNAFGTTAYQDNPNSYLVGYVSRADVAQVSKSRTIIVLEVRPMNTFQMFSQQLQLCDGIAEELGNKLMEAIDKREVIVFTYSRIRHLTECNDLYRIDQIAVEPLPQ